MRPPRIFKGPASAYVGTQETVREISCNDGKGSGALVRVYVIQSGPDAGRPAIDLYRVSDSVRVSVGFDDGYDPVRSLVGALRALLDAAAPINDYRQDADLEAAMQAAGEAIARAEARS